MGKEIKYKNQKWGWISFKKIKQKLNIERVLKIGEF